MRMLKLLLAASALIASAAVLATPSSSAQGKAFQAADTTASASVAGKRTKEAQACQPAARTVGGDVVAQTRKPPCCGECRTNDNGARGCYVYIDRQYVCSSCVD